MPKVEKPTTNGGTKRKVASPTAGQARKTASRQIKKTSGALPATALRAEIERRAYELWEAEGRPGGRDQSHWYRAEQELIGAPSRPAKRTQVNAMAS